MARLACALLTAIVCGSVPQTIVAQQIDPLEGMIVGEVRVAGLKHASPDIVLQNLATRVGEPFRRANLAVDKRQLDELRLFTAVSIVPHRENDAVVVDVALRETLRVLPVVGVAVTDENGASVSVGARALNVLGRGAQSGASFSFGGQSGVALTSDVTTATPGAWGRHLGVSYITRRNSSYEFDERATNANARLTRNWTRVWRLGATAEVLAIDAGSPERSISSDGTDVIPSLGAFVTADTLDSSTDPALGTRAEVEFSRLLGDARSWTFILDGRRYQRLADRHRLQISSLATFQTGEPGVGLPDYLQFTLGGANTVRGWGFGARRGRNQFIGTLEYEYVLQPVTAFSLGGLNLYEGVQLAVFGDVGLAWNHASDVTTAPAIGGYGIGMRILVPFVDLVRVDVAWGKPGRGATAYFGVSPKVERQRQRVR